MKIVIKATNIKLTSALHQYIEEKINSLEEFLVIFEEEKYWNHFFGRGKPRVEAWVEIEKETRHHHKGPFFRAECQMRLPKKSIRSIAAKEDLRLAIDEIKDELQRELKQYKNKKIDKIKKINKIKL